MRITPGPLPNDGDLVYPSIFVPAFVNGTLIEDIPFSALTTPATNAAIHSATDTPVASRGLIWFKRGEGQWYIRESWYSPVGSALSGWAGWAPREEILGNPVAPMGDANHRLFAPSVEAPRTAWQWSRSAPGAVNEFTIPDMAGWATAATSGRLGRKQLSNYFAPIQNAADWPAMFVTRGFITPSVIIEGTTLASNALGLGLVRGGPQNAGIAVPDAASGSACTNHYQRNLGVGVLSTVTTLFLYPHAEVIWDIA